MQFNFKQQQGVALFVSLMLLLILTILSLSAMRGAITETKISGNHQHKQLTFQTAENTLEKMMSVRLDDSTNKPPMPTSTTPNASGGVVAGYYTAAQGNLNTSGSLEIVYKQWIKKAALRGFEWGVEGPQYQADSIGTLANSNAKSHTRLGIFLPR